MANFPGVLKDCVRSFGRVAFVLAVLGALLLFWHPFTGETLANFQNPLGGSAPQIFVHADPVCQTLVGQNSRQFLVFLILAVRSCVSGCFSSGTFFFPLF